jgi:hypothetical protein
LLVFLEAKVESTATSIGKTFLSITVKVPEIIQRRAHNETQNAFLYQQILLYDL